MADLAQLDLKARGGEARLRALLEDLINYYKGRIYPGYQLALVAWFGKSAGKPEHNLLALFTGPPMNKIAFSQRQSLLWKTGSEQPPFANIYATSVDYFTEQLRVNAAELRQYFDSFEVLYFDKQALNADILAAFKVITEPSGLMKGWYVGEDEYREWRAGRYDLRTRQRARAEIGLVKTEESRDFEYCRGLIHVEVNQRWLPLSSGALGTHSFFNDLENGHPGYFIFEGGSLYRLLKIEVKTCPEYSGRVLEKLRDDRYPEVYLRAVHPPERAAA